MEEQPILVLSVLVAFTIIGVILGRLTSTKSVDDFALGGRNMGFFPSLMTLSGTFVSAVTLMVYTKERASHAIELERKKSDHSKTYERLTSSEDKL